MKLTFSWDDGAQEDLRLFELHEKYEIPGMFFVPTRNREGRDVLTPDEIRSAESKYVSFGGHTSNHTYLMGIPLDEAEREVVQNKIYLEDVLGHEVPDFCLPGGKYTKKILQLVYKNYRTVRTADTMNFTYRNGPLKPAVHFYPRGSKSLLGNAVRNGSYPQAVYVAAHYRLGYFDLIKRLIEKETEKDESTVMIWGHSWELEKYQLWEELENLLKLDCVRENAVGYEEMFKTGD